MQKFPLSCPHCGFSKKIEQQRIPAGSNNIRCPKCHQSFSLEPSFSFEPAPTAPVLSRQPEGGAAGADQPKSEAAAATKSCPTCGEKIHVRAEICPVCGIRVTKPSHVLSKLALLLITFFLGGLGGHRFYQKKYWLGTLYLLFFWTYIPSVVALVEFILYVFKSEADLQRRYPETSGSGIVYAVIIPMVGIALLGILAAIAIPQFVAYREKSYKAAVRNDIRLCKQQAEALFAERMSYPTQSGDLKCQSSAGVSLFYLALGFDEFQIIGYHAKGKKAFLAATSSNELSENTRQEIARQLDQSFGEMSQEEGFYFME